MNEPPEVKICSRVDPKSSASCANPTDGHIWCKPCQAKYQREYQALRPGMAATRGFSQGVEALRAVLVAEFARLGSGSFTGVEVASLIHGTPAPKPASNGGA